MELSSDWIEHLPDGYNDHIRQGTIKSETDCSCGIQERHIHCSVCGKVVSIGDWEEQGVSLGTFTFPI